MKKIFTLFLISFPFLIQAQGIDRLREDFNYSPGSLTANSGGFWVNTSGTAGQLSVTTPGLTYAGYGGASGTTNKVSLTETGTEDVQAPVTSMTSGSVYTSFLINVANANDLLANSGAGDYFFGLVPNVGSSLFAGRVHIRQGTTSGFQLGIKFNGSAGNVTTWSGATGDNLAFGTTHLVVVRYTFNTGSTMDDVIDLWVNPALTAVPPAPAATVTSAVAAGDLTAVGGLLLRQGANTGNVDVDGIIVGTEWANAPLPLQLLNFTALLSDSKVNISWTTTNEINAGIFSVEKSVNGKDFKSIGTVEAKGGVSANNYSLVDERVVAGVSYYRLKMVDKDGSYKYSTIETVKTKSIGLSVYPNPVKSTITVQHEVAAKGAAVSVLTISGKPVFQSVVEAGATQTSIDAAKLAPGSYLVIFI
ncbi:MAG: hypothetical protein K0Q66_1478, partial [Chitinophagaceae bacterium]|nr:hypothetical protein [Chitinophagaceae bacterium]